MTTEPPEAGKNTRGVIYCLENPKMPDLVKIGRTTDLKQRLSQLYGSGVPVPFECTLALEVEDAARAERLLHDAFGDHRVNQKREFFDISAQRVIAAMRLTGGKDVTPTTDVVEDEESRRALETAKKKRPPFHFDMVGIPIGATLHFKATDDDEGASITAQVRPRTKIAFEDEETSLSGAARRILERRGMAPSTTTSVAGPQYWYYEGESLDDRRRRMEREDSEDD